MDTQEQLQRNALWALFRETSPWTGKFLEGDMKPHHLDFLVKSGYAQFHGQPDWAIREGLLGWRVYQITDVGAQAIRDVFKRCVYKKPGLKILDSFTDGCIK